MKSNDLLGGNGKRVLARNTRLHLIANLPAPPLCCVISVSDSSAHFVAEFLHCSVKSKLYSLQPWDTPLRDPLLKTEPIRQEVLSTTVFLDSKLAIFFSTAY